MRTIGQVLKETRESKFYTLEEVEKNTKIRKELLQALEADDYDKLPPTIFIQGFIKNYGRFLGMDPVKLLAIFRRDYEISKHPPKVLDSLSKPLNQRKIVLTPSKLIGVIAAIIILSFFAYLWVEYRQFVGAPNLEVSSPTEQQTVDVTSVIVEGKTDPEAKVLVNNQEVGVDKEGNFKEEIKLSSSTNTITITSSSKFGQTAKVERTVFVKK